MSQHDKTRCPWAKSELYIEYHDTEWGVPVHDDRLLSSLPSGPAARRNLF
jgi:DNA-3-methyladenine glycosylase I